LGITSAAENDLEAIRPVLSQLLNRKIFADKAYADKEHNENLLKNANTNLFTPIKLVKGESLATRQFKKAADDLFLTAVSTIRQPIKSWFDWLIEKSDVQRASKVRNTKGLILHIFGAIPATLCFWVF
jgi:hypothetical protein